MNICPPPIYSKPHWITLEDAWIEYITSGIRVQYLLLDKTVFLRADNFFQQVTCNGRIESEKVALSQADESYQVSW